MHPSRRPDRRSGWRVRFRVGIQGVPIMKRSILGLTLWALLAPGLALAVSERTGDFDDDGVATVLDVVRLINHIEGLEYLPNDLAPLADVNVDGFVDGNDIKTLVDAVLARNPLAVLPAARIAAFSPDNGEGGVAVTRETVVRFSVPLAGDTVIDQDVFHAEFGGERLLTRIELSGDRMKATLFYLERLPASARVRVSFVGDGITDFLGRGIDFSGDGDPGGVATVDFDTLSISKVTGTAVIGHVYAAAKSTQGTNVPLKGVIIEVVGDEENTRTTTGSDGSFMLEDVPAGRFFVNIDGRPVSGQYPDGGYYPFVGKAWDAMAGREDNLAAGTGVIFLPYINPGSLQSVSPTDDTEIVFPQAVLDENPGLAGVSIMVPANALFSNDGTRGGRVGIAPVPPDRLPEPLPPGLGLPLVITIQTDGATNFDRPVPVRFPNLPDPVTGKMLSPGAKSALWSFDHDTGRWEIAGPMTVSADGRFLVSDPGVGVRQPGWHGGGDGTECRGGGGGHSSEPCSKLCALALSGATQAGLSAFLTGLGVTSIPLIGDAISGAINFGGAAIDCYIEPPKCWEFVKGATVSTVAGLLPVVGDIVALGLAAKSVDERVQAYAACKDLVEKISRAAELQQEIDEAGTGVIDIVIGEPGRDLGKNLGPTMERIKDAVDDKGEIDDDDQDRIVDGGEDGDRDATDRLVSRLRDLADNGMSTTTRDQLQDANGRLIIALEEASALGWTSTKFLWEEFSVDLSIQQSELVKDKPLKAVRLYWKLVDFQTGFIQRGRTDASGKIVGVIVRPNALHSIEYVCPFTKEYAVSIFKSADSGRPTNIPRAVFIDPPPPDTDKDGLPDIDEQVIGTDINDQDTDDDGINDCAEVLQDRNPLDGLAVATGVIAAAPAPGPASVICTVNDRAVVGAGTFGVAVFNIESVFRPFREAQVDTPGDVRDLACAGDRIVVADGAAGLAIIDFSDPPSASIIRQIPVSGQAVQASDPDVPPIAADAKPSANASTADVVETNGNLIYAGFDNGDIAVFDLSSGTELNRITVGTTRFQDLVLGDGVLYALVHQKLYVIEVDGAFLNQVGDALASPGTVGVGNRRWRLFHGVSYLLATDNQGYNGFTLADPLAPVLTSENQTQQFGWKRMVANGSGIALAAVSANSTDDGAHDINVYEIGLDAEASEFLATFLTPGLAADVAINNGIGYVADTASGLQVVNYLAYDDQGQDPTVSLTSDANAGEFEEGKVMRLLADASDDVQVRDVQFLVNGVPAFRDGSFPFEHRFVSPSISGSMDSFTIQAIATDTGGNSSATEIQTIDLVPDATPPTVRFVKPVDGAVVGQVDRAVLVISEPIDPDSVDATSVRITEAGADELPGTGDDEVVAGVGIEISEDGTVLTISFNPALGPGLYLIEANGNLTDLAGNGISPVFTSSFRVFSFTDNDGDGVPDELEEILGLDPTKFDTDGDGTSDGQEDFDRDGVSNAAEAIIGFDPTKPDTDEDGTPDAEEDRDADGLVDFEEFAAGTALDKTDTDGDGLDDYSETLDGSDPLSAQSGRREIHESLTVTTFNGFVRYGSDPDRLSISSGAVTFFNDPTRANAGERYVASPPVTTLNE